MKLTMKDMCEAIEKAGCLDDITHWKKRRERNNDK